MAEQIYSLCKGYTLFLCKMHETELFYLDKEFSAKFMQEMILVAEAYCENRDYECIIYNKKQVISGKGKETKHGNLSKSKQQRLWDGFKFGNLC
ncbi:MAG: hypothetical protein LUF35_00855 [Lachnospiraceae bacterium]|nr:hypothetical protein [Lachnospiraceae bacterium]